MAHENSLLANAHAELITLSHPRRLGLSVQCQHKSQALEEENTTLTKQPNITTSERVSDVDSKSSTAVRLELMRVTPIDFESIALTARPSCFRTRLTTHAVQKIAQR